MHQRLLNQQKEEQHRREQLLREQQESQRKQQVQREQPLQSQQPSQAHSVEDAASPPAGLAPAVDNIEGPRSGATTPTHISNSIGSHTTQSAPRTPPMQNGTHSQSQPTPRSQSPPPLMQDAQAQASRFVSQPVSSSRPNQLPKQKVSRDVSRCVVGTATKCVSNVDQRH